MEILILVLAMVVMTILFFAKKILSELNIGNSILKFGSEATITNYNTEFCSSIANGVIPTYTKSERKERTVATFANLIHILRL